MTEQTTRHRIERLGHFDVMIAVHLRRRVERHVIALRRDWQQTGQLFESEQLERAALRRAVGPHPGPLLAPLLGSPLRVG